LLDLVWKGCPNRFYAATIFNSSNVFDAIKKKGNEAFLTNRYVDALRWYDMALDYCTQDQNPSEKATIWTNKAACCLELGVGFGERALECCKRALALDPGHLKAVYRRVKSHLALGEYGDAATFLKIRMSLYPELDESEELREFRYFFNTLLSLMC
jgi:tetratricopeptide (TPR) repeat protein